MSIERERESPCCSLLRVVRGAWLSPTPNASLRTRRSDSRGTLIVIHICIYMYINIHIYMKKSDGATSRLTFIDLKTAKTTKLIKIF